jgi:predicted phosphodiesterase
VAEPPTSASSSASSLARARRVAPALAIVVAVLGLALAGVWLGLRIASPGEYETQLGRVSVRLTPSATGRLEAYVPLADWGVRLRPFSAPMTLHVEPRTANREVVLRAAAGEAGPVRATEAGLRTAIRRTVLRSVRFALGGAALLAVMLALTLAAFGVRRRAALLVAPLGVLAVAALICAGTVWRAQATVDERALDRPTFFARGAELVQLLEAAENARRAGDGYASKVQGAVRGFASLLADPTGGTVDGGNPALLASDLHDNRLALGSLREFARDKPVFFVGDFGNTGNAAEARLLARPVAQVGRRVLAVSGNHDSTLFMRALARRGVTVLTRDGVLRGDGSHAARAVAVDGLRVAGFDDPREWRGPRPDDPRRIFSFSELPDPEQAAAQADRELLGWYDGLRRHPDIVLVHQNGLAQRLARTLHERGDLRPLTILTGHDHAQHVTSYGRITVVDAGTVGASGLYGVGRDAVGLGDLHFHPGGELRAADLIAVEPVSGAAQARRVIISPCAARSGICRRLSDPSRGRPRAAE